jgi:DNA-binding transcriptional ArsR family regulator
MIKQYRGNVIFILGSLLLGRRISPGPAPVSDNTVQFLTAIAHKKRLLILIALLHEEMSVHDLLVLTGLSPSALSQHLTKLRQHRLISVRRATKSRYYRVCSPRVEPMLDILQAMLLTPAGNPVPGQRLM